MLFARHLNGRHFEKFIAMHGNRRKHAMLLLINYRNYVIYSPRKLTKERTYLIPTYICIWFDTLAFSPYFKNFKKLTGKAPEPFAKFFTEPFYITPLRNASPYSWFPNVNTNQALIAKIMRLKKKFSMKHSHPRGYILETSRHWH